MTCGCARRRKSLRASESLLRAQGKTIQAAAIGAVIKTAETVGSALGINGEGQDDARGSSSGSAGPDSRSTGTPG